LTFGFPLEAISDTADREQVFVAALEWFGVQSGVDIDDNDIVTNQTHLILRQQFHLN